MDTGQGHDSLRASFTLIEILVVIAIVAALSVVVVLILNPLELLKQSRDSNRFVDLANISKTLNIFSADQSSDFIGAASTIYVSVADSTSTCANLGLPGLPVGWSYGCSTENNLKKVDGTGWVPVDLTSMSFPPPFSRLPVDPVNTTSTGLYYTYTIGGSFELTAGIESDKYGIGGERDKLSTDGGDDFGKLEFGTDLFLNPSKTLPVANGLIAHFAADRISGLSDGQEVQFWTDLSGNGNNLTSPVSGATSYPLYKVNIINGWPAVRVSYTRGIQKSSAIGSGFSNATYFIVAKYVGTSTNYVILSNKSNDNGWWRNDSGNFLGTFVSGRLQYYPPSMPTAGTYLYTGVAGSSYEFFINGDSQGTQAYTFDMGNLFTVGVGGSGMGSGSWWSGDIPEIIVYNRALSSTERQTVEAYLNSKYAIY